MDWGRISLVDGLNGSKGKGVNTGTRARTPRSLGGLGAHRLTTAYDRF